MRIRDLIENPVQTKLGGFDKTALRGQLKRRRQLPTEQEELDAVASEHRVEIALPEAPPDAAFREMHGVRWVPPAFE